MAANYDNSAWFYDRLSRVVYGNALVKAQVYLLPHIPPGSNILIAGGGTGWILEAITNIHPSGLNITYAEISPRMMALSQKRNTGKNDVVYVTGPVEEMPASAAFDVVITPFLFDNFTEQTLQIVFTHVHQLLKPGGVWLNMDFHLTGKWWQSFLLRSMMVFFRLICGIEAKRLPDIENQFKQHQYQVIDQRSFFGEFILSTAFKKTI